MQVAEIITRLGGYEQASETLGVKRTTLSMWRKNGRVPPRHVPAVARALGVAAEIVWPELRNSSGGGGGTLAPRGEGPQITNSASQQVAA